MNKDSMNIFIQFFLKILILYNYLSFPGGKYLELKLLVLGKVSLPLKGTIKWIFNDITL